MVSITVIFLLYSYVKGIWAGNGLIAYNCSHEEVTSREFSLIQHRECPNFLSNSIHSEQVGNIQLLQRREFKDVHGYAAKIVRTLRITPCAGGAVTNMFSQRVLELTRKEVENIYGANYWADEWLGKIGEKGSPMRNLNYNGTTRLNRNLRGWTHEKGYCGPAKFQVYGLSYEDAVLQGIYEVYLTDGRMTVDLQNDRVRTFGGTVCTFSEGHCQDYIFGDIFWSTEGTKVSACDTSTYVILYEGPAIIRRYERTEITDATEVVTVTKGEMAFSLIQKEKTLICGQTAARTEHPKLFIVSLHNGLRFFNDHTLHRLDMDLNLYRDSKFVYLERHLGRSISELNAHVMASLCKFEAQMIANLQSLAAVDPIEFAYAWNRKPGFTALIRGEVVHMVKCVPVSVHIHTTTSCTHELPVLYLGQPMYMSSRSHILSPHGEQVSCNAMFPVKYKLQNQWFSLGPTLVQSRAPEILKLNINYSDWAYTSINVGTAGIYTTSDLNRQRMAVLFPLELRAITRSIASSVGGYQTSPNGFKLSNLVDNNYLENAIASYWHKLHSGIQIFGIYSGVVMGCVMIGKMLSTLCQGGVNCYILNSMFGKCCGLLGLMCPVLANSIILFGKEEMKESGKAKATIKGTFKAFNDSVRPLEIKDVGITNELTKGEETFV